MEEALDPPAQHGAGGLETGFALGGQQHAVQRLALLPCPRRGATGRVFLEGEDDSHANGRLARPVLAEVPFVSSVTGAKVERLDAEYWWLNIRRTVRFFAAMETVRRDLQPDAVLEIAPHGALQPMIAQRLEGADPMPACIPTLMRDSNACLGVREALGALFLAGRWTLPRSIRARSPSPACCPGIRGMTGSRWTSCATMKCSSIRGNIRMARWLVKRCPPVTCCSSHAFRPANAGRVRSDGRDDPRSRGDKSIQEE